MSDLTPEMREALPQRFWDKVRFTDSCWLWTAYIGATGYGKFRMGRTQLAHRVAYAALIGPIPAGLTLDHLCRVKSCVNPAHLEPTTIRENNLRSPRSLISVAVAQTACINGHEFTEENTRTRRVNGRDQRECRTCVRARKRDWWHKSGRELRRRKTIRAALGAPDAD